MPFGRTNLQVPPVWLRLGLDPSAAQGEVDRRTMVERALEAQVPLDLTTSPGLWGGMMRGSPSFLTFVGNRDFEKATDDRHAADLVSANLIESLSAIGREHWDIYFLRIRRAVEEYQIAGALEALELARQEGHVRFLGLACDGPAFATLATWQFHDAFEVLLVPDQESFEVLGPVARERRVGVVGLAGVDVVPSLVNVSTLLDIEEALR